MPRPLRAAAPVILLVLYGSLGLLALGYVAGLVALGMRGSGIALVAARLGAAALLFVTWLYVWRRLAIHARMRYCRRVISGDTESRV